MIKKLYIPKFTSKIGIINIKIYYDIPPVINLNNANFTLNGDIHSFDLTTNIKDLNYVLTQFDLNLGYIEFNQIINNKTYNAIPIVKNIQIDFSNVTEILKTECKNSWHSISYFEKTLNQKAKIFPINVYSLNKFQSPVRFDPHPQKLKAIVRIKYESVASSKIKDDYTTLGFYMSPQNGVRWVGFDPFFWRTNQLIDQAKEITLKINNVIYYYKINDDIIYNAISESGELVFECDEDEFEIALTGDTMFKIIDVSRILILGHQQNYQNLTLVKNGEYYFTSQEHDVFKFGYITNCFLNLHFSKINNNEIYNLFINNQKKAILLNQDQSQKTHEKITFDQVQSGIYQDLGVKLNQIDYVPTEIKNTFITLPDENFNGFEISELENGDVDIKITASNEIANQQKISIDSVSNWHDLQNISVTIEG